MPEYKQTKTSTETSQRWPWRRPLVALAHEGEEEDEDVDDIDVQLEGAVDVLLGGQLVLLAPHDHLGVVDQELHTGRQTDRYSTGFIQVGRSPKLCTSFVT